MARHDVNRSITIRLDQTLSRLLDRVVKQTGRTRSEIVREAMRRRLRLIRFEHLRRQVLPFAEARGCLTDEDRARRGRPRGSLRKRPAHRRWAARPRRPSLGISGRRVGGSDAGPRQASRIDAICLRSSGMRFRTTSQTRS